MRNSGNEPPFGQEPDPQRSDPQRLPPHGDPVAPPGWGQQQPGQPQPAHGQPPYGYPVDPAAHYGRHPRTGEVLSDKSKLVAGLLQLLIPLGIGRMYMGHVGLGVAQLVVTIFTCGVGGLWPFVDGIIILAGGNARDAQGRPLRD